MSKNQKVLLVHPGDEDNTEVYDFQGKFPFTAEQFRNRKYVEGSNGRKYMFHVFVNENIYNDDEPKVNLCATLSADPLGEAFGNHIYGPAILISQDPEYPNLDLNDWKEICQGVWYNGDLIEKNSQVEFN